MFFFALKTRYNGFTANYNIMKIRLILVISVEFSDIELILHFKPRVYKFIKCIKLLLFTTIKRTPFKIIQKTGIGIMTIGINPLLNTRIKTYKEKISFT